MSRKVLLTSHGGTCFIADLGLAQRYAQVFVSQAGAVRCLSTTANLFVRILMSVPHAWAWNVTVDHDSVYINPPSDGLHWLEYSVEILAPAGHRLRINDRM